MHQAASTEKVNLADGEIAVISAVTASARPNPRRQRAVVVQSRRA